MGTGCAVMLAFMSPCNWVARMVFLRKESMSRNII